MVGEAETVVQLRQGKKRYALITGMRFKECCNGGEGVVKSWCHWLGRPPLTWPAYPMFTMPVEASRPGFNRHTHYIC